MKKKIRHDAGPIPPLRQLKLRTPEEREWAFSLRDKMTNTDARGEIREKLGISLGDDSKYSLFCAWQLQQREWDALGEFMEADEAGLANAFPNLSREKIRDAAIKRSYATAELLGDPKFRLKVVKLDADEASGRIKGAMEERKFDQKERQLSLDREKFLIDSCEKILKAARDEETQRIANSKIGNAEKIAWVRERYFADVEALQKQGGINLPK